MAECRGSLLVRVAIMSIANGLSNSGIVKSFPPRTGTVIYGLLLEVSRDTAAGEASANGC